MKKFLFIVLLLCILAVGGIVGMVALSFNPSAYERDVVAYLQKLTGRDVSVEGTTAISWNPEPTVTLNNLRISNIDKGQNPVMLSVEKVTVSIAWKSLLSSPLEIKQIELVKPVLHLERLESNRANFTFPFLLDPNFQLQEVALLSSGSATAKIDSLLIREGIIDYSNQITDADFQITGINGTLAIDSVRGPFRFKGTGIQDKGQYTLSANVGTFQGSSPIPVSAELSENNTRTELTLRGTFTPRGLDKWFDGAIQFNVGRLDVLLTNQGLPLPDLSGGSTATGSATLLIAPTSDTLKDFVVQIGEGDGRSAFTGTFKRTLSAKKYAYDVDVATDLFRLTQWQPYLDLLDWHLLRGEKIYPTVQFKALAKSVPYGADALQDVAFEGSYDHNILSVNKGSATLPANGKMVFQITGKPQNQEASLECGIQADMPSVQDVLKGFLSDSKGLDFPTLAQKGTFTGRIVWQPKLLTVSMKTAKIGDTNLSGTIQKTLGDNPSYTAKLSLSNVNLDTYTGWTPAEKPIALGDLPEILYKSAQQIKDFNKITGSAVLDIQGATVFGVPVERLYAEGSLNNNTLTINRLIAMNMAGADVAVATLLNGIGQQQVAINDFQIGLKTKQLPAFLKRLNLTSELPLINQASNTTFKLTLKEGKGGLWGMDTLADLSNASLKLKGILDLKDVKGVQNMSFEIAHPNFQTFMKLLDPAFNILPKLDGTFKTTGTVSGTKEHFDLKDTTVAIGLQKLSGNLSFDNRQIKTLTADITAPSLDLERFTNDVNPLYSEINGLSKKVLNLSALNDWNLDIKLNASQLIYKDINIRQANAKLTLQDKELNLVKLTGTSGTSDQAPVNVTAKLDWNTTPTFTTNFDVKNIPLRSDFMTLPELVMGGGALSLSGELKARGETPADFVANLNGQGSLALQGGQLIGVDVEKMIPIITRAIQLNESAQVIEPEFKRVLNSGKTVLSSLSGDYTISNGTVRMMDLTLETPNTVANPTQIVWDIPKRTLDISIPVLLKPLNSLPPFILGASVASGRGVYKPNYADLLAALSNQSQAILTNNLRQKEEAARVAAQQKRSDRLTESKRLTDKARQAVTQMRQKMKEFPFEKGKRLLATSQDTLTLLNQLAVKEEPTDAQLIQQIEYAKTILLKADEFNKILEEETLFSTQKQMDEYRQRGNQMADQLQAWYKEYPDFIVLEKLAQTAEENRQQVEQLVATLKPDLPPDQANEILSVCGEAFEKIEQAYQRAARFDLAAVPNQVTGETPQPTSTIRGSFKRSK